MDVDVVDELVEMLLDDVSPPQGITFDGFIMVNGEVVPVADAWWLDFVLSN